MFQHEEWRPIDGFPDYQVSDRGRVLSRRPWRGSTDPRELRGSSGSGYRAVLLSRPDGTTCQRYVHQLVAEAFVGPRPEGLEVRHLDGDKTNNSAANLLYGTSSENSHDTVRHGRNPWVSEAECRNGHVRTSENTHYWPSRPGSRVCLDCHRPRNAEARRRYRAAARAAA